MVAVLLFFGINSIQESNSGPANGFLSDEEANALSEQIETSWREMQDVELPDSMGDTRDRYTLDEEQVQDYMDSLPEQTEQTEEIIRNDEGIVTSEKESDINNVSPSGERVYNQAGDYLKYPSDEDGVFIGYNGKLIVDKDKNGMPDDWENFGNEEEINKEPVERPDYKEEWGSWSGDTFRWSTQAYLDPESPKYNSKTNPDSPDYDPMMDPRQIPDRIYQSLSRYPKEKADKATIYYDHDTGWGYMWITIK